jgi:hypothetical protein
VSTLADLRAGDIMFARKVTPWAADLLILAGQWSLGEPGWPHHVGVVTEAGDLDPVLGRFTRWPKMVQAMPSGAEEIEIGPDFWTSNYVYVRPRYMQDGTALRVSERVARAARGYIGTPYSFADYAAIEGVHLGIENGPIRRYVTSSKHQICSQLADQSMSDAGFHVFTDGRLPQDVTPGALYKRLLELPGTLVIRP